MSLGDAVTWTHAARTRSSSAANTGNIAVATFQFLGSTEITYNSINEFIDNRPTQVAVIARLAGLHARSSTT